MPANAEINAGDSLKKQRARTFPQLFAQNDWNGITRPLRTPRRRRNFFDMQPRAHAYTHSPTTWRRSRRLLRAPTLLNKLQLPPSGNECFRPNPYFCQSKFVEPESFNVLAEVREIELKWGGGSSRNLDAFANHESPARRENKEGSDNASRKFRGQLRKVALDCFNE